MVLFQILVDQNLFFLVLLYRYEILSAICQHLDVQETAPLRCNYMKSEILILNFQYNYTSRAKQ